jgi:hypothetical protein
MRNAIATLAFAPRSAALAPLALAKPATIKPAAMQAAARVSPPIGFQPAQ